MRAIRILFLGCALVCISLLLAPAARAADGPAAILVQPTNSFAWEGEPATFAVQVDGTPPLSLQWWHDGEPIPGATDAILRTTPMTAAEDRSAYFVIVTNLLGAATSSNAVLSVQAGIELSVSANRYGNTTLYQGWPLKLEVGLVHPVAFFSNSTALSIGATNGPWWNALELTIQDAAGQTQAWTLHPAPFTNETLELTADAGGRMLWSLSPAETTSLPPGDFSVTAVLNTTNVARPGLWQGWLRAAPCLLTISNEPPVLDETLQELKHRTFAEYAVLQGDSAGAQQEINMLLSDYPTNIGGLTYDIYLKQAAGQFDDALRSARAGLDQVALDPLSGAEPPRELLFKVAELENIVAPPVLAFSFTNQQISISWTGYAGVPYRLEASMNLRDWSVVTTNFAIVGTTYSYTLQTNPSGGQQFFRVGR